MLNIYNFSVENRESSTEKIAPDKVTSYTKLRDTENDIDKDIVTAKLAEEDHEEIITKDNILCKIFVNIFSSSFGLLCFSFFETFNLVFMGYTKEGGINMASIGIGNIFLNFFGVLMGFGFLGGLDTMGSYCFGIKKYRLLGIYTIRTRINVAVLFFAVCVPFSLYSEGIIYYLNNDLEVAYRASIYIKNLLPAVFVTFNFNLNVRHLQVMQIYLEPTIFILVGIIFHFLQCYIFIIYLGFEIRGICLATFVSMTFLFVLVTVYTFYIRNQCDAYRDSLLFYDKRIFNYFEFFDYLLLCIYSGVQHFGDYIGYEIITMFGAWLSTECFVSSIVVLNYANLAAYLYVGFTYPLSHFVGICLGKQDLQMYQYVIEYFYKIFLILAMTLGLFTIYFSDWITSLYTDDHEVKTVCISLIKLWALGITIDIFNMYFQGVLRGAGKQKLVCIWNLFTSFFWMVPMGYVLCFTLEYGTIGLWSSCVSYVTILCMVNWVYFLRLNPANVKLDEEFNIFLDDEAASLVV